MASICEQRCRRAQRLRAHSRLAREHNHEGGGGGGELQQPAAARATGWVSRRPETRNDNELDGARRGYEETDERQRERSHQRQRAPANEAKSNSTVRRDHFYDRQPNSSETDYLLLEWANLRLLGDVEANRLQQRGKRVQLARLSQRDGGGGGGQRQEFERRETFSRQQQQQQQHAGEAGQEISCCSRGRRTKAARCETVIESWLPCERVAESARRELVAAAAVGQLLPWPDSLASPARNHQMNSRPSCDTTPRRTHSRSSNEKRTLVEGLTGTTTSNDEGQEVLPVSNTNQSQRDAFARKICKTRALSCNRPVPKSAISIWFCWTLAVLVLGLLGGGSPPLVWPQRGSLIMQSSATPVAGDTSRPPPVGGNLSSTTKLDDELSRAVLATMSTQSSLAGGGGGGGDQRRTRPLAMPQGGLQPADELDNGGETTGATLAQDDFEQTPPLSPPVVPDVSNSLELATRQPETAQRHHPNQLPTNLDAILDNVTEFARIFAMVAIMIGDICGNSLVILSVVRHSKLRVTTNWFVVSLACADILVALFAMTFNASVQITGRWIFPRWMCDFWNSCDVLASTASILHLCCISIDRYYAIMRPLDYPMKITTRRVCYALAVVWISSALLSYIPIFTGIYTTNEHDRWQLENPDQCEFVVNRVYAIVSSSISFWIPCCIMVFTYWRIYREATRQEKFIYRAQNMLPAPQLNHSSNHRSRQQRSKSMAVTSFNNAESGRAKTKAAANSNEQAGAKQTSGGSELLAVANSSEPPLPPDAAEKQPLTGSALDLNNNSGGGGGTQQEQKRPTALTGAGANKLSRQQQQEDHDERDSNSGQSTPTKRSISKMKREHKAAKTLGIIMGVFIICWLPFFCWYTPVHICGPLCDQMVPKSVVTLLFWIGYFNSTLNPIIYAYFNHEFRDAFKKTLQWIFCCCRDLKCLRVNRPNDNQHYNCTYRSTQEIGLVTNG